MVLEGDRISQCQGAYIVLVNAVGTDMLAKILIVVVGTLWVVFVVQEIWWIISVGAQRITCSSWE